MRNLEEVLKEFEEALNTHDWTYMMSDDPRWRVKGQTERANIRTLVKEIYDLGGIDRAKELWKEIAPIAPMMSTQFSFPNYKP